jgi:hypothetical protein
MKPVKQRKSLAKKSRPAAATKAVQKPPQQPPPDLGPTTRKTIEVPEEYFHRVRLRAAERRIMQKDLWAEILHEYFTRHPVE